MTGLTRLGTRLALVLFACGLALPAAAAAASPVGPSGLVAFWHLDGSGNSDIAVVNGTGVGGYVNQAQPNAFDPVFSPNGRRIAFTREVAAFPSADYEIWEMNVDGTGARAVASGQPGWDMRPQYSPDGRRIVFQSTREDTPEFDLWVMNLDGSGAVNLTRTPSVNEGSPGFSPDGRRIVFHQTPGDDADISVMNADGSGVVPVISNTFDDSGPEWSPDGTRIVFGSNMGGGADFDIWTVNPDGTNPVNMTPASAVSNTTGAFSADARSILFASLGDGDFDIYAIPAAGGAFTNLSNAFVGQDIDPSAQPLHRCRGRRVTITGDDGPDKIKGTSRADVIAAFAGKDKIKGRGGNDRICGGRGKDILRGGKGKDGCAGGQGRDRGSGCEKGKL